MAGAVAKSFRVLEAVSTSTGPVRLSALADALDLQKSTVHRVLAELIELGYVEQEPATGLYRPTLRTWEIGTAVVADLPVKQVAATTVYDLHQQTGETVSLVVRSGDDALYVDKVISPRPAGFSTRVGSRVPLPSTIGGLAILAGEADGPDVVRRIGARTDLRTPIDLDAVLRSLDTIRRRGYAVSSRHRVTGVAAAIVDRDQRPVGALIVSAPTDRMDRDQRAATTDFVVAATARLSESLGRSTIDNVPGRTA